MKHIKLGKKDSYAIVDDADYDELNQWKWYLSYDGYAYRASYSTGKRLNIRMHRQLLSTPADMDTDHINGDRLDNRRLNLRVCNRKDNLANRPVYKTSQSKLKGVSFHKGFWRARIQTRFIGNFNTRKEAAMAYDNEALHTFGDFAVLNNIGVEG